MIAFSTTKAGEWRNQMAKIQQQSMRFVALCLDLVEVEETRFSNAECQKPDCDAFESRQR
jgi:hypothetical protein